MTPATTIHPTQMGVFAHTIVSNKYFKEGETSWEDVATRVVDAVVTPLLPHLREPMLRVVKARQFIPAGRFLAQAGAVFHQTSNCFLLRAEDSREGWSDHMRKLTSATMTGGGVGTVYSNLRGRGAVVNGMGGTSSGPIGLMHMSNESARHIMSGGNRRAALWAGLHWWHPDIFEFIALKDWSDDVKAAKEKDFSAVAPMDGTNISVILDDNFFLLFEGKPGDWMEYEIGANKEVHRVTFEDAQRIYWETVERMVTTAEPGFSVDTGENMGENLRNPCCEITSADPDDICCLGSINLARIVDKAEMDRVTTLGTAFLVCGTIYGKVPYEEVAVTREKNRRIGLGLMGVHEWLIARRKPYGPDHELGEWLDIYRDVSDDEAFATAMELGVSVPVKKRALAPAGTIGIAAETTTGIEPIFGCGYKRRYLTADGWKVQYVVDATAQRMVDLYGVDPDEIETAYSLARTPEVRVAFQAWVQQWVDHAISSTINLPAVSEHVFTPREFGTMLLKYLPKLRGVTVYPDGARGGQPLTVVPYTEAWANEGTEYSEDGLAQACVDGTCGT